MKAHNKAPYLVILFVAAFAMLLAPMHAAAQTSKPVSDEAAYAQKAQQPPAAQQPQAEYEEYYKRMYTAGRSRFIVSSTLASFYAGLELTNALAIEDLRLGAGTVLGTTALGFLGSYFGSKDSRITVAMADAYDLGLILGAANGALLSAAASDDERVISGATIGGMTLGGALGLAIAKEANPTRGQVGFVALTSKLGLATAAYGLTIGGQSLEEDSSLGVLAGGMDLGAVIGLSVAPRIKWSLARTRLVGLGSFLGALAGWSSVALITGGDVTDVNMNGEANRAMAAGTLLGMWTGFGISAELTSDMPSALRFQKGKKTTIAPAPIEGGMGLSLSGVF